MSRRTTILFAGGGSGGHLYPGVAVAEELMNRNTSFRCLFMGSDRAIEMEILAPFGFEHLALPASSSSRFLRSPISSMLGNWRAYQVARKCLSEMAPSVVIGLGGFASVPVVLAAWRLKIPIVLLEQNAVLGRANRVLLPFADMISLSFPNMHLPSRYLRLASATGNPVRREILKSTESIPHQLEEPRCLLILGGSQGATGVNEAVVKSLPRLRSDLRGWQIIHQTGAHDFDEVKREYARLGIVAHVAPFLTDMGSIYSQATLAVSRAGATTLAELAIHRVPSLLIPYPQSIRDHQALNAEHFARSGGAVVVPQSKNSDITARQLCDQLRRLIIQDELRASMQAAMQTLARPQAASLVVNSILEFCPKMRRVA
jgi:UDP-N-acetylglucosamine--N-acetylmuramyl-(pentapeptide) pyrophosphoryl-undecaprenol N-acetylglucosamine transferase